MHYIWSFEFLQVPLFIVQIAKNRFDGELDILMMNFDKESLGFTLKDKLKAKKGPQNKDKQQLSADLGQDDGESS